MTIITIHARHPADSVDINGWGFGYEVDIKLILNHHRVVVIFKIIHTYMVNAPVVH